MVVVDLSRSSTRAMKSPSPERDSKCSAEPDARCSARPRSGDSSSGASATWTTNARSAGSLGVAVFGESSTAPGRYLAGAPAEENGIVK